MRAPGRPRSAAAAASSGDDLPTSNCQFTITTIRGPAIRVLARWTNVSVFVVYLLLAARSLSRRYGRLAGSPLALAPWHGDTFPLRVSRRILRVHGGGGGVFFCVLRLSLPTPFLFKSVIMRRGAVPEVLKF